MKSTRRAQPNPNPFHETPTTPNYTDNAISVTVVPMSQSQIQPIPKFPSPSMRDNIPHNPTNPTKAKQKSKQRVSIETLKRSNTHQQICNKAKWKRIEMIQNVERDVTVSEHLPLNRQKEICRELQYVRCRFDRKIVHIILTRIYIDVQLLNWAGCRC
jgi:hypothetical protein